MMVLVFIALGGALGALARYGLSGWVHTWTGTELPWGTFTVNALGCFLIGFALRYLEGVPAGPGLRALVTVGLLGAFTTFSTYAYESMALLRDGEWGRAALYSLGSLAVGLVAVGLGLGVAEAILRARG